MPDDRATRAEPHARDAGPTAGRSTRRGLSVLHPHPDHGPRTPRTSLPPTRPGSVRRTTTHDTLRPGAGDGPIAIHATGRDLLTRVDRSVRVLDEVTIHGTHREDEGRVLGAMRTSSGLDLTGLDGLRLPSGFRSRLTDIGVTEGSVEHQLLDDLPTTLIVGGYGAGMAGLRVVRSLPRSLYENLCAGFAAGGSMLAEEDLLGETPVIPGPPAPDLFSGLGPGDLHAVAPLPPHGMRRLRVIACTLRDGLIDVEQHLRDHHVASDGTASVVHEYTVHATWDPTDDRFVRAEAIAHVVPWKECPGAAASAARLVGTGTTGLRRRIRDDFRGVSTCTHLNDTLRALADLPTLVAPLLG